jgi:hypothetical protein
MINNLIPLNLNGIQRGKSRWKFLSCEEKEQKFPIEKLRSDY